MISDMGTDCIGYATLDKSCRYVGAYPQILKKIEDGTFALERDDVAVLTPYSHRWS
jgi:hypothetical protein